MSVKKRKVIDNLNGKGTVYENDKLICEVMYRIEVAQEYIISHSSEIPGMKEIIGQIQVLSGEMNLANGKELVLKLKDGRKWKFFASHGDAISGIFKAVNVDGSEIVVG